MDSEEIIWRKETEDRPYRKDLTGKTFGKWRVDSFARYSEHGSYWNCTCTGCGKQKEIRVQLLTSGKSKSCGGPGCRTRSSKPKNRETASQEEVGRNRRVYLIWTNLMEMANPKFCRCNGRGELYKVAVQDGWKNYDKFYEWSTKFKGLMEDEDCTFPYGCMPMANLYLKQSAKILPDGTIYMAAANSFWTSPYILRDTTYRPKFEVDVGYNRLYRDPFTGKARTRQELAAAYDVPKGTLDSRLSLGWSLEEALMGIRK